MAQKTNLSLQTKFLSHAIFNSGQMCRPFGRKYGLSSFPLRAFNSWRWNVSRAQWRCFNYEIPKFPILLSSHPIFSWKVRQKILFGRCSFKILRALPWLLMCLTAWTWANLSPSISEGQDQFLCLTEEHSCESLQQQWLQVLHLHIPQVPTQIS